ncbi:MAG TPA: hypothetical protein PKC57_08425 [Microthrixaceae bacterium]|nr:hypothetical protein [Microthrixaceae bacterium]HNE35856.1 hypothetical protein [Microthrixaceae bacterium]HNG25351.1 hypothetical protein [Microthrixaceae bacterium]HNH94289.1 hypothetical protein [Microthrixaceae bacterium]
MTFRRRRLLPAFAVRFGWTPRQVDELSADEFELFEAVINHMTKGG